MRRSLSLLLFAFVAAEIAAFIVIGGIIGVVPTLVLTLGSCLLGAVLLRRQGAAALRAARREMESGRQPTRPLFTGAVQAAAALLLIAPGFVSDLVGGLLFVPAVQDVLWDRIKRRVVAAAATTRHVRRPFADPVLDLQPNDYRFPPRPESPWRGNDGL